MPDNSVIVGLSGSGPQATDYNIRRRLPTTTLIYDLEPKSGGRGYGSHNPPLTVHEISDSEASGGEGTKLWPSTGKA